MWSWLGPPDQPFHNSRVSRSGDRETFCIAQKRGGTNFETPKLWKGQSGWSNKNKEGFFKRQNYRT